MISTADQKLRCAAIAAFTTGLNGRSLMELERFGGPACGAAGSIARRWPATGVEERRAGDARTFRLVFVRTGRRSEVYVQVVSCYACDVAAISTCDRTHAREMRVVPACARHCDVGGAR